MQRIHLRKICDYYIFLLRGDILHFLLNDIISVSHVFTQEKYLRAFTVKIVSQNERENIGTVNLDSNRI